MSRSAFQLICDQVAATLSAPPALGAGGAGHSPILFEDRNYPLADAVTSQIHVDYGQSTPEVVAITGAPVDWSTDIEITIKARRDGPTSAKVLADSILVDVYARVMGDQSLGGRVALLQPGAVSLNRDELDTDVCSLTWTFSVQHRTANNVIT